MRRRCSSPPPAQSSTTRTCSSSSAAARAGPSALYLAALSLNDNRDVLQIRAVLRRRPPSRGLPPHRVPRPGLGRGPMRYSCAARSVARSDVRLAVRCRSRRAQASRAGAREDRTREPVARAARPSRREWYRYHHLFGELLRRELVEHEPELVPVLHSRAADWYEARATSSPRSSTQVLRVTACGRHGS